MINYITIVAVVLLLFKQYLSDYKKGLLTSIFLLVLLPENLTITINILLPSFTIHRLIFIITFIFWVRNKHINKKLSGIPFLTILSIITLSFGISTILSPLIIVSLKRYLYFLFESVIFFVILKTSLENEEFIKKIIKTVAFSLLLVCIIGIVEKYTRFNPIYYFGSKYAYEFNQLAQREISPDYVSRDVRSTYIHRILFGMAAAIGVVHFLFLADKSNKKTLNYIYNISFLLTSAGLYFSMSRGPWVALILSVIFISLLSPVLFTKKFLFMLLIVFVVFMIRPGTRYTIASLFRSTIDPSTIKGSSFRWRFILFEVAFDRIYNSESPLNLLFGFGHASHVFMDFGRYQLSTGHTVELESWDSEFAVILLENGFVGLLLIIYFYIYLFIKSIQCYILRKTNRKILIFPLATMIIVIFMKTNVKIFASQLIYLEFISVAILSTFISMKSSQNSMYRL